jgi:trimethylamine--corrinoid protein Co-methyltransferase
MVEDALEKCPAKFKWQARNDDNSVIVGQGYLVQACGGPVFIQDLENRRRLGTLEDFANIQKLYQSSNVVDLVGYSPVDPSDVKPEERHIYMMYEIIKNTDKPVFGYVCGGKKAGKMLDMMEIAFGQEGVMQNSYVAAISVNPRSPLCWSEEQLDTLNEYARRNQIVSPAPCSMAGFTTPMSLLGTTVVNNAEILSGIVLAQLINPGNPILYNVASTVGNMQYGTWCSGAPEMMLQQLTALQVARDLYHLPNRVTCGITDSKLVDYQAGIETMQNVMMGMLGGGNIIHEAMGVLDNIMTVSYEKMILDEEIIGRVKRIWEGVDSSEEALSVSVIQEVGPGGTYIDHQNTFRHCRELWRPTVSNWDTYAGWEKQGSEDVVMKANRMYKERLRNAPDTLIDSGIDKELRAYMQQALRK